MAISKAMQKRMSDAEITDALMTALRMRYPRPEWCFMTEVPDGTGANASRRADAFAYNLYPSKGNVAICFELKASKSDLKRELKDGMKSNAVGQFADYFFLVCPEGIIDDTMLLPKTWGILVFKDGKLRQVKKPEELKPAPMDKNFVAALLQSMFRETDAEIAKKNRDIDNIVHEKLREELEYYSRQREESFKRTIAQQKAELEAVSTWRDAMRKCYSEDYREVVGSIGYGSRIRPYKTIDEVVANDNIVNDLADFIDIRRRLKDEATYAMNVIRHHAGKLESAMNEMQKILLKDTEGDVNNEEK